MLTFTEWFFFEQIKNLLSCQFYSKNNGHFQIDFGDNFTTVQNAFKYIHTYRENALNSQFYK